MTVFDVEFAVHLGYDKGNARFERADKLPFPPFIGLDVLDDVLGEFRLEHVAWHSETGMFFCQANVDRNSWTLRQARRALAKTGWAEDIEARSSR